MGPGESSSALDNTQQQPPSLFSDLPQVPNMSQTSGGIKKINHVHLSITKMKESLDNTNWIVWHERICCIFRLCNVKPYVYSQLMRPDLAMTNPDVCDLWDTNDVLCADINYQQYFKGPDGPCNKTQYCLWNLAKSSSNTQDKRLSDCYLNSAYPF